MKTASRKSHRFYRAIKRFLDIIFSLIGMIFLLPITIIVGPIIKLQDGGPIFFKQARTGRKGKDFNLYKFRSMPVGNDVMDFQKEDQMTKFGCLIRKTSIDELPQLWNILKGEMSFVGPRPWIPEYHKNMNEEQRRRYLVRPGITGLAQVKGRNNISVLKKIKYDIEDVDTLSLRQDVKIVFLTIATVFKKESAYSNKHAVHDELAELKESKRNSKVGTSRK